MALATSFFLHTCRGEEAVSGQTPGQIHPPPPGSNPGPWLDSWLLTGGAPRARSGFAAIRAPAPCRHTHWHSCCVSTATMELSRFVVAYRDVRPGEHVLYSVLTDRYIGIDQATSDAVEHWTRGRRPADAAERETAKVLLEEGFVVRSRAEDDADLRDFLGRAAEGIPERSEEHTSELQSLTNLVCRLLLEKKNSYGRGRPRAMPPRRS